MWHRDMKWANVTGKNGTKRLALNKMDINLQFVKKKKKEKKNAISAKCKKQSTIKGMPGCHKYHNSTRAYS